jgi:hypothetical protein
LRRFELPIEGEAMALAYYTIDDDGQLVLTHTEVPAEYSGRGLQPAWHKALSRFCAGPGARRC